VSSFLTAHQHIIGHFHHKNYKDVTQTKVVAAKADTDDATQCNTTVTTDAGVESEISNLVGIKESTESTESAVEDSIKYENTSIPLNKFNLKNETGEDINIPLKKSNVRNKEV